MFFGQEFRWQLKKSDASPVVFEKFQFFAISKLNG